MKREELVNALSAVKPGLAAKEVIEQTGCFIFKDKRIITYNDSIAVAAPFPEDIDGAVNADELYKLVNRMKAKEIDVEVDGNELLLSTKRITSGIPFLHEIEAPIDSIGDPGKWKPVPKNLKQAIEFCLFCVGTDMTRPVLTGVHVTGDYVEACDVHRIAKYTLEKNDKFDVDIIIPGKAATQLVKHNKIIKYSTTQGWVHFKVEGKAVFSCRLLEYEYPNITHPDTDDAEPIVIPADIADIVDRAAIFDTSTVDAQKYVILRFSKNSLLIRGEGEKGWVEERVKIKYAGSKFSIKIHPSFLRNSKVLTDDILLLDGFVMFRSPEFVHIAALTN